jgi:AcrR family transcriptional regulator
MPRGERRDQLLDLAADLIRDGGLEAVRMEALAAAAGINKTIVYRVFPNRTAVLLALFEREVDLLGRRIEVAVREADGFEGWLQRSVEIWFDTMASGGRLLDHMLDTGPGDPELDERRVLWARDAAERWGRGIAEAKGVRLDDAMDTAAIMLAGLRGAVARWMDDGRPRHEVERRFVRLALAALGELDR